MKSRSYKTINCWQNQGRQYQHLEKISPTLLHQDNLAYSDIPLQNQQLSGYCQPLNANATAEYDHDNTRNAYLPNKESNTPSEQYQEYLIDYYFHGSKFSFSVFAKNWSEAEQRLMAIKSNAWVEGCLAMRISVGNSNIINKLINKLKAILG